MILAVSDKVKAFSWAMMPLVFAIIAGSHIGAPYSAFAGMGLLGFLTLIYNKIGGAKAETFKVYALFVFVLLAISIGGWADQGIR